MLRVAEATRWAACGCYTSTPPGGQIRADTAAARWAADALLYGGASSVDELVGRQGVDDEIAAAALEYARSVGPWRPAIELRTWPTSPLASVEGSHGLDVTVIGAELHVVDLSMAWRPVDPVGDATLLLAALGSCTAFCDRLPAISTICATVFQPRPWHPDGRWRRWTVAMSEIERWTTWIVARAENAASGRATAEPCEGCATCAHASRCPGLAARGYATFERLEERRPGERLPAEVVGAELEFLDRALAAVEARRDALRAEAEARIRAGEWIPGQYLKEERGYREWKVPLSAVALVTGVDPHKQATKSPAEVEREGGSKEVVKTLTHRPARGVKLARIERAEIRKAFK